MLVGDDHLKTDPDDHLKQSNGAGQPSFLASSSLPDQTHFSHLSAKRTPSHALNSEQNAQDNFKMRGNRARTLFNDSLPDNVRP